VKKLSILSLTLLLGVALSCDSPTGPTTGGISIVLLSPSGIQMSVSQREDDGSGLTPDLTPFEGAPAKIALDGARITVTGPTNKTVTNNTPSGGFFNLTVDGLAPGTYTVTVEGLVNGQVGHFGSVSSIVVTAGNNTAATVPFPVFQPVIPFATVVDTTDVLRFTISYGAVTGATGYLVAWSLSPTMSGASSKTVTGTSTEITVTQEGKYYVTVRAINSVITGGGLPSPAKAVYVFQGVATVTVTPPSPTIAAGSTQQLTAEARDADNGVVTITNWFWASSNHSVATVSSTGLVTGVNGGQATITAMAKGTPGSSAVGVTALPGVKVAFSLQPGTASAGQSIPNVQVAVQNINGQTATADNTTQVTVAIGSDAGPGGVLTGLQTVSVVAGIANFNNLAIAKAGSGYTLTATATGLGITTSALFNVAPGAATHLTFTVQPTGAAANTPLSPAIQVSIQDALNNRVTSANDAVAVAIDNNPGAGTLNGTKVVNAINGVASFSGLSISAGGTGYTLSATSGSLTLATSSGFDIGAILPAFQLAFSIQPASAIAGDALSPAVQVEIRDQSGALVTTARDPVTIAFAANPGAGTLTGTKTVNAINGVASFTGLWINKTGTAYTLAANSGTLAGTSSSAFNITPAAAAKLAISTQPINVQGNVAITGAAAAPLTVTITDMFDNATTATNPVTVSLGNNPWKTVFATGATLSSTSGLLTRAAVDGVATFSDLKIDKPAPGYALLASSGVLTSATSSAFNTNLTFTQISVGSNHTCGRTANGAYCWGYNGSGQLGVITGNTGSDSIAALVRGAQTFATVTAGSSHSCGLTAAGAAFCWGYNGNGQLGNNTQTNSDVPVAVSGGLVFQSISAGGSHTCGLTTDAGAAAVFQQVYCWGENGQGQGGDGLAIGTNPRYLVPSRVAAPLQAAGTRATQISAGSSHTCARAQDTNLYCWGNNYTGQLGNATVLSGCCGGIDSSTPVLVVGFTGWTSVSAGTNHTCGVRFVHAASSPVLCWGYHGSGQLGIASATQAFSTPQEVSNLNWLSVSAGSDHSCAVLSGGQGYCWGYNGDGRLGDDSQISISTPVTVAGSLTFLSIHAGGSSSCGRTASAVYCWGSNGTGQLGSPGTSGFKKAPTQIVQ